MSNGASGLALLTQEGNKLLLGEVAAWLLDWQKCIPFWKPLEATFNPGDVSSVLESFRPAIPLTSNASTSLKEILERGRDPSKAKYSSDWRIRLLGVCHDVAHVDKPELAGLGESTRLIASVFGYEISPFEALPKLLGAVNHIEQRRLFLTELEEAFNHAVGDTRRPINEVTLWDWGSATATLWKAIAARNILENQTDGDLRWRTLSINFDGIGFLERAPTISDLVGRQAALQAALDEVRELLEVTYPLGNEVYRDENGSAFIVPALDGDDAEGNQLRGLIENHILNTLRQSELGGELRSRIHITEADKQAAVLHKVLEMSLPPVIPFEESLQSWWKNPGDVSDVCTTCGMRPQGWGAFPAWYKEKAQRRNVCCICLERRGRRAQIWAQARHKTGSDRKPWDHTIWLDEVADDNGHLALVVGKFDLTQWLNGNMIQTLLVVCDPNNSDPQKRYIPKNPSFARIQRVWRTTQQFWQNVQNVDIPAMARQEQQRLSIMVSNVDALQKELRDYHAYEAEVNGRRLSVIWDSKDKCLLTADNLLAWTEGGAQPLLDQLPEQLLLFEPGGYGQQRAERIPAEINRATSQAIPVTYSPIISLLSQPVSFMALVPAAIVLDVATKISQRYELEMSKVRNRLPLFLGLVFFDRRQPLFSALDAGRRLLESPLSTAECTVTCSCPRYRQFGDTPPAHLDHSHFERWQELILTTPESCSLHWYASTVMGDGNTDDDWYPYMNVIRATNSNVPPTGRKQFEHNNQQWIHVRQVQNGDIVRFTPSCFTWLHLDTSARRFEAGEKVFPLEELSRITTLWKKLQNLAAVNKLSESQLHAIVTLLITKEKSWGTSSDEYWQLAEAILNKEGLDILTVADLTSGRLQATFELYHHILKQKL